MSKKNPGPTVLEKELKNIEATRKCIIHPKMRVERCEK